MSTDMDTTMMETRDAEMLPSSMHAEEGDHDHTTSGCCEIETTSMDLDDSDAYFDAQLESIDQAINVFLSSWPVVYEAPAKPSNVAVSRMSAMVLASSDDASSIYSSHSDDYWSDDTNEPTASLSSGASSSSESLALTPQSPTPPQSAKFLSYHQLITSPPSPIDSSFQGRELVSTTENLFELISQIPMVESVKTPKDVEADAADCYMYNDLSPTLGAPALLQKSDSRSSRPSSLRSSANSANDAQSVKRSSLKRMSTLLFRSKSRRQVSQ